MLTLQSLKPKKGSRTTKKRIGRGLGSKGSYSGRGVKGQRARSGGRSGLKLKGLRTIMLSTPKSRGFTSPKPRPQILNVEDLAKNFSNGTKVTIKLLKKKELIREDATGVKILGTGEIGIALTIEGCLVSKSAKEKIEKAGGVVITIK
ncbi:50S ribosomal protein L15 [Candidatus Uhrbacteria bacterium]|nr:50S ribosomal protein L15 [Candidatus Uhrbacteria bacterium]